MVVLDTTKVQIFKQITTSNARVMFAILLFQIPQRYRFSSKSQPYLVCTSIISRCFRYHKGTDFQANHNEIPLISLSFLLFQIPQRYRFSSKSQRFVKSDTGKYSCFRYHKGTDFQANHNRNRITMFTTWLFQIPQRYRFSSKSQPLLYIIGILYVVLDTTKVQIFKQITTNSVIVIILMRCFRYHKGTDFQANHNIYRR